MVEIRPNTGNYDESNFLTVKTYRKPTEQSVRLAIIEWWKDQDGRGAAIQPLVEKEPMSKDDAMEFARRHAEEHGVPVIYSDHSD